jgi:hypothetical protein
MKTEYCLWISTLTEIYTYTELYIQLPKQLSESTRIMYFKHLNESKRFPDTFFHMLKQL